MNAAEHVAKAERLLSLVVYESPDERSVPHVLAAVAHGILALVATLTPADTQPEPHSTAWCNARDSWDSVPGCRRFDDLDPDMQARLAARWQARHG